MPTINLNIKRAWWYANEDGRIHYIKVEADGTERHLYVDEGVPLFNLLSSELTKIGYTGPRQRVPA